MTQNPSKLSNPPKPRGLFRSIRVKFILAFSLLFMIILVLINAIAIFGIPFSPYSGRLGVELEEAIRKLNLAADLKKQRILNWKEEIVEYARLASTYDLVQENVIGLHELWLALEQEGIVGDDLWEILGQENHYFNLVAILDSIESSRRIYHNIYVTDLYDGVILASTVPSDMGTTIPIQVFFSYNSGPRREYMTDVIIGPKSGKPSILIGHVITNSEDKGLAILIMEIDPESVLEPILYTKEALGEGSEAYLVNKDQRLVTATALLSFQRNVRPAPLSFTIRGEPVSLALQGKEGVIETPDHRKKIVLAAFRHIPMGPSWDWGLIVQLDKGAILSTLRKDALDSFLIGLIGLFALIAFTVVLVENMTRPVRNLSWTAIRVAKGDLTARADVSSRDEVGTLSTIFNSMILRIHNWRQELENQVNSRTEELNRANEDLKREIAERIRMDKELKKYSENLEEMVEQRTNELRMAQEELVKKEKLAILGLLAGGVGHELRNPLGVINNAVFYLKTILPVDDPNTREYLDIISSEVLNAEKIVSDLMDYAGLGRVEKELTYLFHIARQILEEHPPNVRIEIIFDIPDNLPPIYAEPSQIYKSLFNLIANACQAMPEGGTLALRSVCKEGVISLYVEDNGVGVSPQNLDKIFDPLFTTKARGIGLGLSVAKSLIEANGGAIQVSSVEGEGSVFIITFPVKENHDD